MLLAILRHSQKRMKCWHYCQLVPVLIILILLVSTDLQAQLSFTRITTGDPVTENGISSGVSWGDYDHDGFADLFVANWSTQNNSLYLNEGGGVLTRIVTGIIVNEPGTHYSSGPCWGDVNNDGFPDMFVAGQQGWNNTMYLNDQSGGFTAVEEGSIVEDGGASFSCAWGDYDNDSYLDLIVANANNEMNFLYHNLGGGTFERILSGAIVTDGGNSFGAAWADYDNDGLLDLFVANREGQNNFLYHNDGGGSFSLVVGDPVVQDNSSSHGGIWGDIDNDGDFDLFVANGPYSGSGQHDILYINDGDGTFTRDIVSPAGHIIGRSGSAIFGDLDNDGDLDLYVSQYYAPCLLYLNDGTGTFTQVTSGPLVSVTDYSSGMGAADYDNDGDLDIYLANWENRYNILYRNDTTGNAWVEFNLLGTLSNRLGVGARVYLAATVNGSPTVQTRQVKTSYGHRSQDELRVHYGLGDAEEIDYIKVLWPSGTVDSLGPLSPNAVYTIVEGFATAVADDPDYDGLTDASDNCPMHYNPLQDDLDEDGIGNRCDECPADPENDIDGDGLCAESDNCPYDFNPGQEDWNSNDIGDACDPHVPCCGLYDPENRTGNVDQDAGNVKDLTDILLLASYAFMGGETPPCLADMNVSGDLNCVYDLSDVLDLASYAYLGGEQPAVCLVECQL